METKRRIHDGIVGLLITVGVALGYWLAPAWLILPGVVGLLLVQSYFTGFCPVYYTLDRLKVAQRAAVT
ncbi:MAG TPA: DUF2892 domain-containing protein [Thermoanaerobaculia bacterium]|nr:DUF2892 domain-containing protein [Thermoanaerobaculia bacterium]